MLFSRTAYSISSRSIAALVDSLPTVDVDVDVDVEPADFDFNNTHLVDAARTAVLAHNNQATDNAATVAP